MSLLVTLKTTCPGNYSYNPYSNTCLRAVDKRLSWQQAKEYCEHDGEYLATFETLESVYWLVNHRRREDTGNSIKLKVY